MRRIILLVLLLATFAASAQPVGILPVRARITPANAADVSLYMLLARRADRLLWSPGGSLLAVVDATDIDLYNVSDWLAAPRRIRVEQALTDFAFSPDGSLLYTLAAGSVVAWNTETGEVVQRYLADARRLTISPDGETIAVLARQNQIQVIDAESREAYSVTPTVTPDDIAFSSDGSRIFVSDGTGGGELIDLALRQSERAFAGTGIASGVSMPGSAAYSGDGRRILSQAGGDLDAIRLWNPRTGEALTSLTRPAEYQQIYGWGLNARTTIVTGAAIGTSAAQGAVIVWPLSGGAPLAELRHPGIRDAQPSPDGSLIASVGGGTLRLWAAGESLPTPAQTALLSQVNVVAACDTFGVRPALGEVLAGQTISLVWSWYAATPALVRDYLDTAVYRLDLDGLNIRPWIFVSQTLPDDVNSGNPTVYFYAPVGGLALGQHTSLVDVTWVERISDGFAEFGPGASILSDGGTCAFSVR